MNSALFQMLNVFYVSIIIIHSLLIRIDSHPHISGATLDARRVKCFAQGHNKCTIKYIYHVWQSILHSGVY